VAHARCITRGSVLRSEIKGQRSRSHDQHIAVVLRVVSALINKERKHVESSHLVHRLSIVSTTLSFGRHEVKGL